MSFKTLNIQNALFIFALSLALFLSFSTINPSQAQSATADNTVISQSWHGDHHGQRGHGGYNGW